VNAPLRGLLRRGPHAMTDATRLGALLSALVPLLALGRRRRLA
jgi:hypothetical protein